MRGLPTRRSAFSKRDRLPCHGDRSAEPVRQVSRSGAGRFQRGETSAEKRSRAQKPSTRSADSPMLWQHTRHYNTDMRKLTLLSSSFSRSVSPPPRSMRGGPFPTAEGRKEPAQAVADSSKKASRSLRRIVRNATVRSARATDRTRQRMSPRPTSPMSSVTNSIRKASCTARSSNGHPPAMPAFKSKLTKNDAWTLVEFVKSLRKPS